MNVRLWGTRGSIPTPERSRLRYGGNTSCLAVSFDEHPEQLIILDAGTGMRELGLDLMREPRHMNLTVLLSHVHWDHIQGIPSFKPLHAEGTECTFVGGDMAGPGIEQCLRQAIAPPFFPVALDTFRADVRFRDVSQSPFQFGPATLTWASVHHPGGAAAWKLTHRGRSLIYMPDCEIPLARESAMDEKLLAFSRGADLLIHDAQYTPQEYAVKKGWGHSSCTDAVRFAMDCGAGRLVLFHHDPGHDDTAVDGIVARCREMAAAEGSSVECIGGWEGLELEV